MAPKTRRVVIGMTLADFPDILAQLDPTYHSVESARVLSAGGRDRLNWVCDKGPDHTWDATVKARCSARTGCPCCSGNKVSITNCLRTRFPALNAELLPANRNGGLTGLDITAYGTATMWWVCPRGHEYDMRVRARTAVGANCPYCSGKRLLPEQSLAALRPDVAEQWHPTRNGGSTPWDFLPQSNQFAWFACPKSALHDWKSRIQHRVVYDSRCPYCAGQKACADNCLAFLRPDIARELDPVRSGFTADDVTQGSGRQAAWICATWGEEHRWTAIIGNRTRPTRPERCPYCSGKRPWRLNNLAVLFPAIAAEYDPSLNGGRTAAEVLPFSAKMAGWRCRLDPSHAWRKPVTDRTGNGTGCKHCHTGRRFSRIEIQVSHLLATVLPIDPCIRFVEVDGKDVSVDIVVTLLRLAIEYDGGWWHRNKRAKDTAKNATLEAAGWGLLRIREAPLAAITAWDIVIQPASDPVTVATLALRRLAKLGFTTETTIPLDAVVPALEAAEAFIDHLTTLTLARRAARMKSRDCPPRTPAAALTAGAP